MNESDVSRPSKKAVRPHILIVDDQPDVARTFGALLVASGMTVALSPDGVAALELLRTRPFDLVVVDMKMPPGEWGGVWLLHQLHAEMPLLPAIVLSGEGAQAQTIEALRAGALDWLVKDNVGEQLVAAVQRCLVQGQARVEAEQKVRRPSQLDATVEALLLQDEGQQLERKASARLTVPGGARDQDANLQKALFKTVAGFLNSPDGGVLLLGVQDDGAVYGVQHDFVAVRPPGQDAYERWLVEALARALGRAAVNLHVRVEWETVGSHLVGLLRCQPSEKPIFVSEREFYVRQGNATARFEGREIVDFIATRWKGHGR
jgi:DNA-binding response OmpR family regulator